jgi:antitoxin HigA-1
MAIDKVSSAFASMTNGASVLLGPKMVPWKLKMLTIIEIGMQRIRTHPGEVLGEDNLAPPGMSARQLAAAVKVPASRVSDILRERRGVSADTAMPLGRYFGTDARFWLNLQLAHDLSKAESDTDYSTIEPRAPVGADAR